MSLRWGSDDETLSRGMSAESAAAQADATRLELEKGAKADRLASINAERARKARALKAQSDLNKQLTRGAIDSVVKAGIQGASAYGNYQAKKGQTVEGMKGRLVELEGTPPVEGTPGTFLDAPLGSVEPVEGDIAKLGEGGGFLGMRGRKRAKLTKERDVLRSRVDFMEENPEMAAYMQGYK